jgi:intraflagellar transport protein 140
MYHTTGSSNSTAPSLNATGNTPGSERPTTANPGTTETPASLPTMNARKAYSYVNVLFATSDQAPVLQDNFPLPTYADECIGIEAPYIFFRSRRTPETSSGALLKAKVMRDFVGMENIDETTKTAMLDFGYHMALGNMDEAYKAVSKLVKNTGVWNHLARMSVQTRRLDVLGVCLGNMGHARAARALREAIASAPGQPLVHLAAVAIHLGMHEDAINLLVSVGRSDLLNAYYQASGNWENAIQIANTQDRINLRTTHYNYAKHLEILGDLTGAIPQYEAANSHRTEVPRMLLSANSLSDLEAYIDSARDKSLYMWRAKLCESKAQWDLAFKYYDLANDYLSLIRIRCFQNNFEEAKRIAIETKDKAASYHLAHQFENEGNIKEALQFYSRAECFNHGIRLAIEHELDADLMNLALQSGAPRLMVQAAHHFEEKGNMDKAVMLYQKGGALRHAVQLCISARLYDQLESVVNDLDQPTGVDGAAEEGQQVPKRDPELLAQCANFFIDHHQFERAAHLLVLAGDGQQALELCLAHNIPISEDMADQIAPPLRPDETPEQSTHKIMLLRLVAKCCKRQGAYHLATKKYTQAKDKLKAMKVLLKSGDTEKIIFFAGMKYQKYSLPINPNFFYRSIKTTGDLYYGSKLPSNTELEERTGNYETNSNILHKSESTCFTGIVLRSMLASGDRRIPKLRESNRSTSRGTKAHGESTCQRARSKASGPHITHPEH